MGNRLVLDNIVKDGCTIHYKYSVEGYWERYFHLDRDFFITYSFDITNVPNGVLAIPFVSNILPIAWLCDAEVYVPELDLDFYEHLEMIKKGYIDMFPMLEFKGSLSIDKISANKPAKNDGAALFFSGGADAYTSLLRHVDENPILVTIWGPDIEISNEAGWKIVESGIKATARDYNLEFMPIKSALKDVIDDPRLTGLVEASGEGWWHGFQHGIGIISHMAPIAYDRGLKFAYIASSYPAYLKGTYKCASDPTIDNYMFYCGCSTIHDGYELDRQQKIHYIVQEKNKHGYPVNMRVCWESDSGKNCCHCEKCYRTLIELVSEGADPNEYGFDWDDSGIRRMKRDFKYKLSIQNYKAYRLDSFYKAAQELMIKDRESIDSIEKYQWFLDMDLDKFNDGKLKRLYNGRVARRIRKIFKQSKR